MLTHVDPENNPGMVNISAKKITKRTALARSIVVLPEQIMVLLENNEIQSKKGPVFQTAIIAGTMAAKKTSDLIPFCHPIGLEDCKIKIYIHEKEVIIDCEATVSGKTGVEMEALTGASIAALTVYDMCKAMSHNIIIKETRLLEKKGGKSDHFGNP
jgi:cyclic pyranopterin phosphate synthase